MTLSARSTLRATLPCVALSAALVAGCGSTQGGKNGETFVRPPKNIDVELPQLEIHADGVDRFATCPPSGGVTQGWIPKIPAWTAPATPAPSASAASDAGAPPGIAAEREIAIAQHDGEPSNAPTPTEKAIRDTLQPFRTCYRRGLLHDATQNGHAAIVVRVAADGRVADVESYGACELGREVVSCMRDVGKRLRFEPPREGSATIILPAVFAPRSGIVRHAPGPNDEYAASAAVALEAARPGLHECEKRERRAVRSQEGWGTFVIEVDDKGKVVQQNIEPWSGNQELLRCASDVVGRLTFPPPVNGSATVRARISFNPRGIVAE